MTLTDIKATGLEYVAEKALEILAAGGNDVNEAIRLAASAWQDEVLVVFNDAREEVRRLIGLTACNER